MPKETGLGWTTLDVDNAAGVAKDLRNDTTNFEFSTPMAVQDVTGVDVYAMERLLLLADFSINKTGVFNDAADKSHSVYSTVPTTRVTRTITLVVSGQQLVAECLLTDYAITRAQDGSLTYQVPGVLANGIAPTWSTV